jgi:hypothetical protein
LAESANFKGGTFTKLCTGLIGKRFEMPNVSNNQPLASIKTPNKCSKYYGIIIIFAEKRNFEDITKGSINKTQKKEQREY